MAAFLLHTLKGNMRNLKTDKKNPNTQLKSAEKAGTKVGTVCGAIKL